MISNVKLHNCDVNILDNEIENEAKKAAAEILNSPGFISIPEIDALYPLSSYKESLTEGQGAPQLRQKVWAHGSSLVQALSPQILRSQEVVNEVLYRTLLYKRLGHALGMQGKVGLPDGSTVNLECFHETFSLLMLRGSFESFANKHNLADEQKAWIQDMLSRALCHDNVDQGDLQKICDEIRGGSNDPIILGAGYNWHSAQIVFYKGYFAYLNCGNGCGATPGWTLYKMGNMEKINPEYLHKIVNRLDVGQSDYLTREKIKVDLEAEEIFYAPMKLQKVGNCTYKSLKAAIHFLLTVWELKLDESASQENFSLASEKVKAASENAKISYKLFTGNDRKIVLKDFLVDLLKATDDSSASADQPQQQGVKQFSTLLNAKIRFDPFWGYKIGWKLWSKLFDQMKILLPNGTPNYYIDYSSVAPKELATATIEERVDFFKTISLGKFFKNQWVMHVDRLKLSDASVEQLLELDQWTKDRFSFLGLMGPKLISGGHVDKFIACANAADSSFNKWGTAMRKCFTALVTSQSFEDLKSIASSLEITSLKDQGLFTLCRQLLQKKEIDQVLEILPLFASEEKRGDVINQVIMGLLLIGHVDRAFEVGISVLGLKQARINLDNKILALSLSSRNGSTVEMMRKGLHQIDYILRWSMAAEAAQLPFPDIAHVTNLEEINQKALEVDNWCAENKDALSKIDGVNLPTVG